MSTSLTKLIREVESLSSLSRGKLTMSRSPPPASRPPAGIVEETVVVGTQFSLLTAKLGPPTSSPQQGQQGQQQQQQQQRQQAPLQTSQPATQTYKPLSSGARTAMSEFSRLYSQYQTLQPMDVWTGEPHLCVC
jgi:hypothetical protein